MTMKRFYRTARMFGSLVGLFAIIGILSFFPWWTYLQGDVPPVRVSGRHATDGFLPLVCSLSILVSVLRFALRSRAKRLAADSLLIVTATLLVATSIRGGTAGEATYGTYHDALLSAKLGLGLSLAAVVLTVVITLMDLRAVNPPPFSG